MLGARSDAHPQTVSGQKTMGYFRGADDQFFYLTRLQIFWRGKPVSETRGENAVRQLNAAACFVHITQAYHKIRIRRIAGDIKRHARVACYRKRRGQRGCGITYIIRTLLLLGVILRHSDFVLAHVDDVGAGVLRVIGISCPALSAADGEQRSVFTKIKRCVIRVFHGPAARCFPAVFPHRIVFHGSALFHAVFFAPQEVVEPFLIQQIQIKPQCSGGKG